LDALRPYEKTRRHFMMGHFDDYAEIPKAWTSGTGAVLGRTGMACPGSLGTSFIADPELSSQVD
jgi:hypothetical protein